MTQTVEERIGDLTTASNLLTTVVENKIDEIDSAVANALTALVHGQGNYSLSGNFPVDTWLDIADLSEIVAFTIYVLSTENSAVQPQEWAFILNVNANYVTSIRIDSYGVLHQHSNDLFFQVNPTTKKLQVKKTLITTRRFSVHLKINTGMVTMKPSQNF
jgi:ribosomal protein L23